MSTYMASDADLPVGADASKNSPPGFEPPKVAEYGALTEVTLQVCSPGNFCDPNGFNHEPP